MSIINNKWTPESWKTREAKHQPVYKNDNVLKEALNKIENLDFVVAKIAVINIDKTIS